MVTSKRGEKREMRLSEKSLEELEKLELELHERNEESNYSSYSEKIAVYEEMHCKLRILVKNNKKEYINYLENVGKMLVHHLIRYGTYLKMEYQKDDHMAEYSLKEALRYDSRNPIAAYRLGFLSYKSRDYEKALQYFGRAIENQTIYKGIDYILNEKQLVNAHLYLTNSALYIAKKTYEQLMQLPHSNTNEISNYEFSSLFQNLTENEQYLEQHAFYKVSNGENITCSKEECEELIGNMPKDHLILYFNDRNITLGFNGKDEWLNQNQGDMLRYFLIKSNEASPATRFTFQDYFSQTNQAGEVNNNTFIQSIRRLRAKIDRIGIPPVIQTIRNNQETAYYFDETFPYTVMYRVDYEIE